MSAMGDPHDNLPKQDISSPPDSYKGYALSGKIMMSAIIVLFFVVVLMVCLHLYARWYLLRARRRNLRRNRHNRRTHIVFHEDQSAAAAASTRGLEESVLKTLPVFVYTSKSNPEILECAVCLSEFDDNETGRLLPKCKHSFHIECIDMWFHSHSTCPLCRCSVEPETETTENAGDLVLNVVDAECTESAGSSSGLCGECSGSRTLRGTSSFGARRKPMDIAVPSRHESFGRSEAESPSGQAFRSPMSRMLSFKRILSRDRRNGGVSPSGNASCGSVAELDLERGGREVAE